MIGLHLGIDEIKAALERQSARLAPYRSRVQVGERGKWKVVKTELEFDFVLLRMVRDGRGSAPGTYTRLLHAERGVVMSDTDSEILDFLDFVADARGDVVVAGLGLGVVTQALLAKPSIKSVTVVEIDRDVIALVAPHLACDRLTVVRADARKWTPKRRFDYAWLDIWDDICGDHVDDMRALKSSYRKHAKRCAAWCEDQMEALA